MLSNATNATPMLLLNMVKFNVGTLNFSDIMTRANTHLTNNNVAQDEYYIF